MAAAPSFAEQQLAKYGWKRGEGLGKRGDGIKRAITVSRKTDTRGVGVEASQWSSTWWDHLYDKASSKADGAVAGDAPAGSTRDPPRDTLSEYQGMFVRSSGAVAAEKTASQAGQPVDRTKLVRDGGVHLGIVGMTDAELFAACEGRTARKGARADQSGKLARTTGDGMPRAEVAARIEAALSGQLHGSPADDAGKHKGGEKRRKSKSSDRPKDKSKDKSKRKKSEKPESKRKRQKTEPAV
ncbi:hypothetical protein IWQ57_001464 [Coemansia nantahalensis]|uniref:Uncharacterized protein n=1 Tax=Coemansia nantahalensis TaxID=2789366 RepID=A0ACC1K452_9FUNG|nr:hypothetical protein IWQ57_001464 [Coemansia nantahalensis]